MFISIELPADKFLFRVELQKTSTYIINTNLT